MSWSASIVINHEDGYVTVIEAVDSLTYNLTPMWRKAGVFEKASDLKGRTTKELAPILSAAVVDAVHNRADYEALNPPNGWGNYEVFMHALNMFCTLAWLHPKGTIQWSG